jgi:hypothetical protein
MSYNVNELSGATLALNSGALAIGSTTSQLAIATAVNFLLKGRFYQLATSATFALVIEPNSGLVPTAPNSFVTLAAGQACTFAVITDSAGTKTIVQGPIVAAGDPTPVGAVPSDKVLVGVAKVVNVTNPFIPGTTAFSAAGVTTTYLNYGTHPGGAV